MTLTMFWATVQFITRLPVPSHWAEGADFQQYGRGVPAFPIVGLMVGVLAAGVSLAISQSGGGIYIGALGYVFALTLLTGGFHLDGLADTCDGIFSARKRERMLEIMRDSRLGTYGGLALIFSVATKTLAVVSLSPLSPWVLFGFLSCACVAGRTAMVLVMYGQRYARQGDGMGNIYIGKISRFEAATTLVIGCLLVGILGGRQALAALVITFVAIYALARYFRHHLGGQTGDTLGAAEEMGEMIFLLALLWV